MTDFFTRFDCRKGFPDDFKYMSPWNRLNERKGRVGTEDYIIGGDVSPRNLYPWATFMFIRKNGGQYACGGTLLTNQ